MPILFVIGDVFECLDGIVKLLAQLVRYELIRLDDAQAVVKDGYQTCFLIQFGLFADLRKTLYGMSDTKIL